MSAGQGSSQTGSVTRETGAGAAAEAQPEAAGSTMAATATMSAEEAVGRLLELRARVMPILQAVRSEYQRRVRSGYPLIVDNVARGGVFGLTLDPGWGVYFMTDGTRLFAELHLTSLRYDTLAAANAEKFGGQPEIERRDIDAGWDDLQFRNLVSELLHFWNYQQTRIYRVDS
jgi:hypothetical protein